MTHRIAVVTELFFPSLGGQQLRFKELAEEFIKAGVAVDVYTIDDRGNLPRWELINGVEIHRIVKDRRYNQHGGVFNRPLGTILRFAVKLWFVFLRRRYRAVIFTQLPVLPALLSRFYPLRGSRTILDFVELRSSTFWRYIQFLLFRSTQRIVCISRSIEVAVKSANPDRAAETTCIPSLVRLEQFVRREAKHFIFVGRLESHKHPEDAIKTALHYNEIFKDNIVIHLVGAGRLLWDLKKAYGNNPLVCLHGEVSDETKLALLSEALVMIFPSEREGLPKVVVEAMASAVPVVTTRYLDNATKDFVIDEGIGEVADPDIPSLAQAVRKIMGNYQAYLEVCQRRREAYALIAGAQEYISLAMDQRSEAPPSV
jgi:glycosyltransferase involved in cell wall biosynthesis